MNTIKEINSLRKELKELDLNVKKLSQINNELMKIVVRQDQYIQKKKAARKISYIEWLGNERRINNLLSD